jgi:tRNA-uridine 2-sulfurtransferase
MSGMWKKRDEQMTLSRRAFVLISGGLDSMVTAKILQEQGIHVIGVHFASLFYKPCAVQGGISPAERAARALDIELITFPKDVDFLRMIQNPKYGYGSAINPCIDCRIYYLQKIKPLMKEHDVSFVATGEVLGQRPKSQMRDALNIVERDSGIAGYLVRPLCAHHLEPTVPEREGILDRNKLLNISGRGRKEQMMIAERYGLKEYPNPAGGCQFTEKEFVVKVADLFKFGYRDNYDITILTCGRHYRVNDKTKLILARNEDESDFLLANAHADETFIVPHDFIGPLVLIKGEASQQTLALAAGLLQFYSKKRTDENVYVDVLMGKDQTPRRMIKSTPLNEKDAARYRLKPETETVQ